MQFPVDAPSRPTHADDAPCVEASIDERLDGRQWYRLQADELGCEAWLRTTDPWENRR